MANREQRSSKETRKPKKEKAAKGAAPMPMSSGAGAKPAAPVAWKQKQPK